MSPDDSDTKPMNRRSLLKAAGASALLVTGIGTATAESDTEDCGWEYQCLPHECPDGGADTLERRYCCNGSCSGWEVHGCCA